MKRGLLRGGLISILIVSLFVAPLSVPLAVFGAEDPRTATGFAPEKPSDFGIGAIGGISSCLAVMLTIEGGGRQKLAQDLATTIIPLASVPVYDLPVHLNLASQVQKEGILNCVAGALAKSVIRQLTKSIVNWIDSGFQGKPAFVQDLGKFLTDIADEQIGEFIHGGALAGLCSPFALQVRITIARSRIADQPVQCTLTKVVGNVEGFFKNFQNGGWPAWLALTTVTTNNPYGAYIYYENQLDARIRAKQAEETEKVRQGSGFLSFEVCVARSITGGCLRKQVLTPGSVIAGQLNQVLPSGLRQLELADSIAEILDALMVALLQQVFTSQSGLAGLGSVYASGGSSNSVFTSGSFSSEVDVVQDAETRKVADAVVAQIDSAISFEQKVIDTKNRSISEIENAQSRLNEVGSCYNDKLGSGSGGLTAEERAVAENRKSNARLGAQALLPRISALDGAIASSTATIAVLEIYRTRALSANTQTEATTVLTDFYQARALGRFSSEFATIQAEQELDATKTEMRQLNQSTDEKLSECFAFPNELL